MNRMKWRGACALLAFIASLGTSAPAAVSASDESFVKAAQAEFLGLYALAILARGKAQSPHTKALASQVADSAGKADTFIRNYAKSHSVALDNKPTIRADAQYGDMQSLSGTAFDQKFAQVISVDMQMQLSDFQDEAQNGNDPKLKAFAKQQIGVLQRLSAQASHSIG